MQRTTRYAAFCACCLAFSGCASKQSSPLIAGPQGSADQVGAPRTDRLTRSDFNRRAVELDQPLFWRSDPTGTGALRPGDLVVTWGPTRHERSEFVDEGQQFTASFNALYERMLRPDPVEALPPEELARRTAVRLELEQGRPTLLESDFSGASSGEKALVTHLLRVAVLIETIYAKQRGTLGLERAIAPEDAASAALFFRNQGPSCRAPRTEHDPACHALRERREPTVGLYPAEIQARPGFCALLEKQPNAEALQDHFATVVLGDAPNTFKALKYSEAYRDEMQQIAVELEAASAGLGSDEAALASYLAKAAQAFRDNDWEPANQAWLAMSEGRSRYYLRVGPDEVYFEPCAWKAGFALAFARINDASLSWKERLEPIKQELEEELAALAGKPYRARAVQFKLPDFIDIVLNAGDNRAPLGATAGQSLPNWGPVAEKGGRTVVMTNIGSDADSQAALQGQMASLYCKATMREASPDPKLEIMGVVLHEAAHNLGPAHDYAVNGKTDRAVFGGPLASTLEELKAQTAALFLPSHLLAKGLITRDEAERSHLREIAWAFGHIAAGMYDSEGKPKNYGQLASIQVGSLEEAGVIEWKAAEVASNGTDPGCFEVHFETWEHAITELARQVLRIKAQGDRQGAEALMRRWVDADNDWKKRRADIAERWLRSPKPSMVYAIGGI